MIALFIVTVHRRTGITGARDPARCRDFGDEQRGISQESRPVALLQGNVPVDKQVVVVIGKLLKNTILRKRSFFCAARKNLRGTCR